ncbi:hypothetical protein [Clostridium arbusti]|uniref:hypothetical protein n=1 Tax=Clostridium arbusti TaxID=1137848 RepID=UPI000289071F|nr:hypothetical protein [Clostridium arbusti]
MNTEPRINSTSLRFSKRVGDIVDNIQGKTFADKFEFIVLDYQEKKDEREAYLNELDKKIKMKKKQLDEIRMYLNKFSSISEKVNIAEKTIESLIKDCNTKF